MFLGNNFPQQWQRFVEAYRLTPGDTVWIVQAGWDVELPEELREQYLQFRDLKFETFGKNIKIFKMTVGQPMPRSPATVE
jgi:hypothetical protein